ncbi:membrane-associated phospholipid phosphatase [Corynebacterium glutamicum]|nr:membrane-associated phospholipid phosphatase [Corynebacterium glutamicum]
MAPAPAFFIKTQQALWDPFTLKDIMRTSSRPLGLILCTALASPFPQRPPRSQRFSTPPPSPHMPPATATTLTHGTPTFPLI